MRVQGLTKRFYGFNSQLVLGPVTPKFLKMVVVLACMVLRTKWRPQNITGRPGLPVGIHPVGIRGGGS